MRDRIKTQELISPNRLPFLQSQVLQKLFLDIHNNKKSYLKDIVKLTNYKKESKILNDAINALIIKRFIVGNLKKGFSVPTLE